jgi:hypothetical protein
MELRCRPSPHGAFPKASASKRRREPAEAGSWSNPATGPLAATPRGKGASGAAPRINLPGTHSRNRPRGGRGWNPSALGPAPPMVAGAWGLRGQAASTRRPVGRRGPREGLVLRLNCLRLWLAVDLEIVRDRRPADVEVICAPAKHLPSRPRVVGPGGRPGRLELPPSVLVRQVGTDQLIGTVDTLSDRDRPVDLAAVFCETTRPENSSPSPWGCPR